MIKLLNNGGKVWKSIDNSFVKGFAFIGEILLSEYDIYRDIINLLAKGDSLEKYLLKLNGNFSAVICFKEEFYLIADKLKTYSLLYILESQELVITDSALGVLENIDNIGLDENAILTYLSCGYLHDNETFVNNCKIVMAGSYVRIDRERSIYQSNYHKHIHFGGKKSLSEKQIINYAVEEMDRAFLRMIKTTGDKPIFIPLSGGYDSRLLVCLCKKFCISNVSCFTYGRKCSYEVAISKKVADKLGFNWYFIEYTDELNMGLVDDDEYQNYLLFANNLNATPHPQDYIAFRELRKNNIIPSDAIIVPGHSGEILGGDQIPYELLGTKRSVSELIFKRYFQWNILKSKYKKHLIRELGTVLNNCISKKDSNIACDLFNNWNIQNRQANFIVNAVRVYEYFGVDWRVPLWDDQLSAFWLSIEWKKKYHQKLYNKYMFDGYFIPMEVDYYKPLNTIKSKFFAKIKLPFGLKHKIKYSLSTNLKFFKRYYDFNNYNIFVKMYKSRLNLEDIKLLKYQKYESNSMLSLYVISKLRRLIGNLNGE